jgi:hypothetical protein
MMEPLWERGGFRIAHRPGQGEALVIAFASIGHDVTRMPSPEFMRSTGGFPTLFVMDEGRSWAGGADFAPGLVAALAAVRARQPVNRIVSLGVSMGGFCALAASDVLRIDATLAFSPQFSVDPAVMPGETRWRDWTSRIPAFRPVCAPLQGWACLFHGMQDDATQALAFPQQPGIDQFLFADQGHSSLAPYLRARGVMRGLIEAAVAGDRRRLVRIATSAGGRLRAKAQLPR